MYVCVFFLSKYSNDFALKVSVLVLVRDLTLYSPCMCMCKLVTSECGLTAPVDTHY